MGFEQSYKHADQAPSRKEYLNVLGLAEGALPDQIIDAYIKAFELYKDQIVEGVYPRELQTIKSAYESLEGLYATEASGALRQGREKVELPFAKAMEETTAQLGKNIDTSTKKLEGDIGSGVDELWGMFGR
jgi:hypothetical protein